MSGRSAARWAGSRRWAGLVLAAGVALGGCRGGDRAAPPEVALEAEAPLQHVELVTGGASSEDVLPMIVVLHGLGDTPEQLAGVFSRLPIRARLELLRAPDAWGRGYSWFPVDVRRGAESVRAADLSRAAARIAAATTNLTRDRPTAGRPIVTGFSQGGMLSLVLALHHPDQFRRAIALAGWIPDALIPGDAELARAAPIYAVHGERDTVVPFALARSLAEVLKRRGAKLTFVTDPEAAHAITPRIWALWVEQLGL